MLKNRFFTALAFAGVLGFAACGEEAPEAELEAPAAEEGSVQPMDEPTVSEPAVAPEAGATEILGNGIDDDADGLVDEEA